MKVRSEIVGVASFALLGLFGCMKEDGGEAVNEDDAAAVQALSMQEDGSDQDMADATDDAPADSQDCHFASIRKHVIATYDSNHDGKIDASERDALNEDFGGPGKRAVRRHIVRGQRIHWLKQIYDADDSGKLDDSERAKLKADLETRCENRMKQLVGKFDTDGDGSLDDSEWLAAREDLAARFAAQRAKLLAEFDQDGNGKLDLEERYDARIAIRKKMEARWDALKDQYDTDHSGKLDPTELAALRAYLQARVRGEQFA